MHLLCREQLADESGGVASAYAGAGVGDSVFALQGSQQLRLAVGDASFAWLEERTRIVFPRLLPVEPRHVVRSGCMNTRGSLSASGEGCQESRAWRPSVVVGRGVLVVA